jgi:hypothetical protein
MLLRTPPEKIRGGCVQMMKEKGESKPRPYESDLCRGCMDKGSSYCKNQCPYNIWRRKPAD